MRNGKNLPQLVYHNAAKWYLAWSQLDFCTMGVLACARFYAAQGVVQFAKEQEADFGTTLKDGDEHCLCISAVGGV